ncbi:MULTISPECIES: autotransporter outer membrane beta-barrel domain-containing protein [unclassified Pseudomonas]|uniref:autotransporter outer membrane beta-barrel domain-containing protein n=1 Tax=unclassified Pseudomonas TaxID=196821 RepID=UPI002115CC9B|nr:MULTISPECIES: autotransporter outer membrane beta-barrel domain-containing protein [unclassified Pseudomonas]
MAKSRSNSCYFKYPAVFPLVFCVVSGVQARTLLPGESVVVGPTDPVESWTMAPDATLTVSGGQILSLTGGGVAGTVNLLANSTAQTIALDAGSVGNVSDSSIIANNGTTALSVTDASATLTNATVINTNGIGVAGNRGVNGSGSAFVFNGGSVSGTTGGLTMLTGSLNMTGTTVTGTGATSYGMRGIGSDMNLSASRVTGGLNGLLYRVNSLDARVGTVNLDGTRVEGISGAAIRIDGQRASKAASFTLTNGTTLIGGNGNALEVDNSAIANVLLQNSDVTGNIGITNSSVANLTFDHGGLTGDVSADATSTGVLALNNGSVLTGNVSGIDTVSLDASSLVGTVTGSGTGALTLNNGSVLRGNVSGIDTVGLDASSLVGNLTGSGTGALTLSNGSSLEGDVTGTDTVSLDASSLTGNVTGSGTGALTVNNGSTLAGDVTGIDTINLDASSLTGSVTGIDSVNLSASSLKGNVAGTGTGALTLNNGSTLTGDVTGIDSVSLSASSMTGDITSDGSGVVSLQNDSVFTGNLIGVDKLTVGDPSVWNMTASTALNTLVMDTGVVKFGAENEFFQLDVGNLSGSGTFVMDVDYATNQHDTLNVTGSATGSHTLLVAGSGVDPVSPEALTMVRTAGGDATFALANGRPVDVGTYSYALSSVANGSGGTDWFLDPSTATVSPGTASVLALFNTAPTVWYGELTSLRSRMGELRFNGGKAGGWVRTYGNKYNVDEASGLGYKQTQQGLSLGADAPLPFGDGQWLIGALAGYSDSDLNLSRGTSGTVKSYYVGAYTTWLDQESGYYFDGVLKFNRFRNDSKVSMSDGTRAKGDYDNVGMGGSVEFGRHIKLNDGYFVEPFTQWSAVVIQGKDYGLDNGMEAEGDRTRSLLGKVGVTAGRNFALQDGKVLQPYVRVAGVHEFAKNNEVQVNNNVFNNDLSGSRGELGAGIAVAFNDRLQVHADFDYASGEHIEQPFGANVGLRFSW